MTNILCKFYMLQNPQPKIHLRYELTPQQLSERKASELNEENEDPIDELEIFEMLRDMNDPEYPLSLEQLNIVSLSRIEVTQQDQGSGGKGLACVCVWYTPTIPNCSMAQIIGLMIKTKLTKYLPRRYKTFVKITPGTHVNEGDINKQINDKERVGAAEQNPSILGLLKRGYKGSDKFDPIPYILP